MRRLPGRTPADGAPPQGFGDRHAPRDSHVVSAYPAPLFWLRLAERCLCVPHSVTWRAGARSTPTTVRPSQLRCIYKRAHAHWLCDTSKQAARTLAVSGFQASSK